MIDRNLLEAIADQYGLVRLLKTPERDGGLGWQMDEEFPFEEVPEIGLGPKAKGKVGVHRLIPATVEDEKVVLLAEFEQPYHRRDLRELLTSLRRYTRETGKLDGATGIGDTVFIVAAPGYREVRMVLFQAKDAGQPKLRSLEWDKSSIGRTLLEFNLERLKWSNRAAWESAWDVERLTKDFFKEISEHFFDTYEAIRSEFPDDNTCRLYVQTLFNRLIFLRFVEKKGWLQFPSSTVPTGPISPITPAKPSRQDYLRALWQAGKDDKHPFWPTRLNRLFNALNHETGDTSHVSAEALIGEVPYLNGGLFEENLFAKDSVVAKVPAGVFEKLLGPDGLFYRYNFTVEESSPLDVQVAVDPEILGKIFEQLTISSKRHDTGSYYTPREIVQFMCREALVGYLSGPPLLDSDRGEGSGVRGPGLSEDKVRKLVYEHDTEPLSNTEGKHVWDALFAIKVVDPACGSGAYLLGMLQELYALTQLLDRPDPRLGDDPKEREHDRKLWIIENNIYGVDLQAFATNTAMLRLWLTLLVEDTGDKPQPLPNLEYKIETGDSLLGPDPSLPVHWHEGSKKKEKGQSVLYDQSIHPLIEELRDLRAKYQESHGSDKSDTKTKLEAKLSVLREKVTGNPAKDPSQFDWRVEFFDVFLEDPTTRRPGFDVALANPPYVRQEEILQSKGREYKTAIERAYAAACVGKSDLFCYFYARTLQMLCEGGYHVFVCSNSWLDVGFGGRLQKYLLENARVIAVYDSAVERQFSTAEVNTLISILQKSSPTSQTVSQFISLRAPFEQAMANEEFRHVVVRTREELWNAGLDDEGHFEGDKWGGKYLRAPDVYWKIMERAGNRLVRLGDIADVRRGFTTGANDFFYVRVLSVENGIARIRCDDGSTHELESRFLRPSVKTPRDYYSIPISGSDVHLFLCSEPREALRGTRALDYIRHGEEIGVNAKPSCKGRRQWYTVSGPAAPKLLWPSAFFERHIVYECPRGFVADKVFYTISGELPIAVRAYLNSTIAAMFVEVEGYLLNHGGIFVTVEWLSNLPVLQGPSDMTASTYQALCQREIRLCAAELKRPDRRAHDYAIGAALGVPNDIIDELHAFLAASVADRIHKTGRRVTQNGKEDPD